MITIPDILQAVENKQYFVLDSYIKQGNFVRASNGHLKHFSGGFTVVFPVEVNNEKWAYRCWYNNIGNVRQRFLKIADAIKGSKANYLCDFVYVDEGIIINGVKYPTTRMRWVEGLTIKDYICSNANNPNKLIKLAEKFLLMVQDMHKHGFAHGDLQHGNILVAKNDDIYLVDYDSFYCPELKGEHDIITGLADYQHPCRKQNRIANEKLDYFSELIIYLSILAIAEKTSLISKYKVENSDRLLFSANDYRDIKHSSIYVDLLSLSNPQIKQLLNILELYLSKSSISDLEPFDVILYRLNKTPEIKVFRSNKSSYLIGDDIRLIWDVDVYTQLLLNGRDVTNQKKSTIIANGQSVFVLEAINNNKRSSKQISIKQYPRPIISFQATKLKLHANKGENVELKWNVQNALKCNILYDDVVRSNVGGSGMITVRPETTTIYTLQVLGLDGATYIEEQLTIDVFPDAEFTFNIDKDVVLDGEPFTLSWNVNNAKQVRLNGAIVKHNDSLSISGLYSETNYELAVYDEFGSKKTNITIKPKPKPQIISFRSSTDKIHKRKNNQVVLTWDVRNSIKVCLFRDGIFLNDCLPSGNVSFNLDDTAQFTLQVLGLNYTTQIEEKIIVNAFPDAEVKFRADKQYVLPDIPFHLSWKVVNAKRVIFDGKDVSHSDNIIIKNGIKKPTEYQLKVEDEFGTKKYPIYINLLNPPQIKTINVPKPPTMVSETHYTFHIPEFRLFKVSSPYVEVSHYKKVSFREVKERYKPFTFKIIRLLIMKNTILAKLYSSIKQKINND